MSRPGAVVFTTAPGPSVRWIIRLSESVESGTPIV